MELGDIPTFSIDADIFRLITALDASKEGCRILEGKRSAVVLRKATLIHSINSSLAIEGNELKAYEVADIINDQKVIGPFDEIVEVQNALKAYDLIESLDTWSIEDFLKAQDEMMFGLVEEPGFRTVGVGVFDGDKLIYKAPEASQAGDMVSRLFEWCSKADLPPPIIAAIAHYYIETIHPFVDGNGRMGRLWNTKILIESDPIYSLVPMETYIRRRQEEYYSVLEASEQQDRPDCTHFIKFCLECLISAFDDLQHVKDEKMEELLSAMSFSPMSLKEIMDAMGFSHRGLFMKSYLRPALEYGLIMQTESKSRSRYQRYRRLV